MGRFHVFKVAYRSHEPERKERGCVEDQPQRFRTTDVLRLVEDTAALRFMGSLHFLDTHWDHEPSESPLNRPPGTFSPPGGEGWDEGVRFMGSNRVARIRVEEPRGCSSQNEARTGWVERWKRFAFIRLASMRSGLAGHSRPTVIRAYSSGRGPIRNLGSWLITLRKGRRAPPPRRGSFW
jgi:hypothetical protein